MKVVIEHSSWSNLLETYPLLERYRECYIDKVDYKKYYSDDVIVVDIDESEFWSLVKELTYYECVIVCKGDTYESQKYGIDMGIEIYDDYRE
jgi:hypothetical protein